jgi:LacI family transcriptional regulator
MLRWSRGSRQPSTRIGARDTRTTRLPPKPPSSRLPNGRFRGAPKEPGLLNRCRSRRGAGSVILIDRELPDVDCDLIVGDNVNGARRLVEHLIAVGHTAIAHITDAEDTSTGRERLKGYRQVLETNNVPFKSELVVRTTVDRIGGYRATREILAHHSLPAAIFAVNNMTAVGTMEALRGRGLAVPKDVGLVCFDDVEHLAVLSPFLTVVDQSAETFGSLGSQLLLERMTGKASARAQGFYRGERSLESLCHDRL